MSSRVTEIGQLSIFRDERLGSGRFGSVFPGKFKDIEEEIAVKKMKKKEVVIDFSLYRKVNGHPNVIGYYGTECSTDADEFM